METSAVQVDHCMLAASDRTKLLLSLVVVGLEVATCPARASGSLYPLTMRRAFARGLPSGCFDYFRIIREVSVLASSVSLLC